MFSRQLAVRVRSRRETASFENSPARMPRVREKKHDTWDTTLPAACCGSPVFFWCVLDEVGWCRHFDPKLQHMHMYVCAYELVQGGLNGPGLLI